MFAYITLRVSYNKPTVRRLNYKLFNMLCVHSKIRSMYRCLSIEINRCFFSRIFTIFLESNEENAGPQKVNIRSSGNVNRTRLNDTMTSLSNTNKKTSLNFEIPRVTFTSNMERFNIIFTCAVCVYVHRHVHQDCYPTKKSTNLVELNDRHPEKKVWIFTI